MEPFSDTNLSYRLGQNRGQGCKRFIKHDTLFELLDMILSSVPRRQLQRGSGGRVAIGQNEDEMNAKTSSLSGNVRSDHRGGAAVTGYTYLKLAESLSSR